MVLLDAHLEQISLCAASIAELPFPPPKAFTNALLRSPDITALIRDTESHERALFSVTGTGASSKGPDVSSGASRRQTTFGTNGGSNMLGGRGPRRNTAVAAVLGGDLLERIRRGGGGSAAAGAGYRGIEGREKGEIEVDVLLEGAEKLCRVYPIPGAQEKIISLRHRHRQLVASIERYEERVARQSAQLSRLNRVSPFEDENDDAEEDEEADPNQPGLDDPPMTEEELKREEEEIRELERKKRGLEARVSSMEKDLTGVLR